MAESEQRKTGAGSDQVVEKDEADHRMEEGEHLLDESDSEDALATAAKVHPGNPPDNMKESAAVKTRQCHCLHQILCSPVTVQ